MIKRRKILSIAALVISLLMLASCKNVNGGKETSPDSSEPTTPEAQVISVTETDLIGKFRTADKRNEAFLKDFGLDKSTAETMNDTSLWASYSVNVSFYNRKGTDITVLGFTSEKNGENGIYICSYGNVSDMGIPADYAEPCEIAAAVLVKDNSVTGDAVMNSVCEMGLAVKYVNTSDYVEDKEPAASVVKKIAVEPAKTLSSDTQSESVLKISSKELAESSFIEDYIAGSAQGIVFSPSLTQAESQSIKNNEWTAYSLVLEIKNVSGKDITIKGAASDSTDQIRIGSDDMEITIPGSSHEAEMYAVTLLVRTQLLTENMLTEEEIISLAESAGLRLIYAEGKAD